jgi:hypothetical protein
MQLAKTGVELSEHVIKSIRDFSLFLMYMFRIHTVLTDLLVTNYLYFTSANSGAGTAYPSGAPESLPGF